MGISLTPLNPADFLPKGRAIHRAAPTERQPCRAALAPICCPAVGQSRRCHPPPYRNDFYGYEFSYPPEGRLEVSGVTGFPSEELPAGLTADAYLRQIEANYPDGICAAVRLEMGTVVFIVAPERGGRYGGPCGWTGVGDYDLIDQMENITIGG
jgi:hypothetical protein